MIDGAHQRSGRRAAGGDYVRPIDPGVSSVQASDGPRRDDHLRIRLLRAQDFGFSVFAGAAIAGAVTAGGAAFPTGWAPGSGGFCIRTFW